MRKHSDSMRKTCIGDAQMGWSKEKAWTSVSKGGTTENIIFYQYQ